MLSLRSRLMPVTEVMMSSNRRSCKSYTELSRIQSFEERYDYLAVRAIVGVDTFGFERWLNQAFYHSVLWRRTRTSVIARDYNRDLGVEGYDIFDRPIVHHMNPIEVEDITHGNADIINPEYLITVSHRTHNAIHYGDKSQLVQPLVQRRPGDTKLW
jgi:hypothetical protein